jgi:ABC-2 type transport system permease protein
MAKNALLGWSTNRSVFFVFLTGKVIRYLSYFGFLYFLVKGTNGFLGYSQNQALFVTATFIFIDTIAQFFFRSVYSFRNLVVSGDFDLILSKPFNPLFRALLGGPDPIDLVTLPPILFIVIWIGASLHPTLLHAIFYIILIFNSLLIYAAFHILVLSIGVITLEVDHLVEVFRDISSMGRFPVDIYKEPLRGVLTFIVPIGIMYTMPAKVLSSQLNILSFVGLLITGISVFLLSLKFWKFALKKYSSASS